MISHFIKLDQDRYPQSNDSSYGILIHHLSIKEMLCFNCSYSYVESPFNANCPMDLQDELKFDCYPEPNANEELCLSRGCCWSPTEKAPYVPFCYYPTNYALYSFLNISQLNGSHYNGVVSDCIQ